MFISKKFGSFQFQQQKHTEKENSQRFTSTLLSGQTEKGKMQILNMTFKTFMYNIFRKAL